MTPSLATSGFTALVLAGSRPGGDPLARAAGLPSKALLPVGGVAMVLRVVRALQGAAAVEGIVVCGLSPAEIGANPELASLAAARAVAFLAGSATPSASVVAAVEELPGCFPLLVTTGDHPLLSPEIVDHFCARAHTAGCDFALGIASAPAVRQAYPGARRTWLRFREGAYCSCNLFALLTEEATRVPRAWRRVEGQRKRPWRLIAELGAGTTLRFLFGRLSLEAALQLASRRVGIDARAILVPDPRAAIDVDGPDDLALVESILRDS